ncbi:MAG: PhnD/SsuA/transferrin family substrate-binding protein [Alcaligenaceae bacterium]|nr:PhnD/SsuA/transferrin family substrate-binding protein [Alcaligenaceae bacterium]
MLITSTRLYDATPSARDAWTVLLNAAYLQAGLRVEFIAHAWPTPVGELWEWPGLCGAFMCGWPFAQALRAGRNFQAVASVVPDWPEYGGLARYRSEFLVRDDAPWATLEDAFGSRYGWMVRDSQSGWNAPRGVLKDHAAGRAAGLFSESKGPYGNPRGLIRALRQREIDLTAIDGWYLDLLRAHDPPALSGLRTLAHTPWTPNPLLVCSPDVDRHAAAALAEALTGMHRDPAGAALLRRAHVERFIPPDVDAYRVTLDAADQALRAGYPEIR